MNENLCPTCKIPRRSGGLPCSYFATIDIDQMAKGSPQVIVVKCEHYQKVPESVSDNQSGVCMSLEQVCINQVADAYLKTMIEFLEELEHSIKDDENKIIAAKRLLKEVDDELERTTRPAWEKWKKVKEP
jgi:hypothetical protein